MLLVTLSFFLWLPYVTSELVPEGYGFALVIGAAIAFFVVLCIYQQFLMLFDPPKEVVAVLKRAGIVKLGYLHRRRYDERKVVWLPVDAKVVLLKLSLGGRRLPRLALRTEAGKEISFLPTPKGLETARSRGEKIALFLGIPFQDDWNHPSTHSPEG